MGTFHLLMAEDDPSDAFFVQKTFTAVQGPLSLAIVPTGEDVLSYLQGAAPYADREQFPMPNLLLLDIKMPRMTGLEVLEWLKGNEQFRRLPVIMISSSSLQKDIDRAFDLGANSYLVKPVHFEEMQHVFQAIGDYWTSISKWPSPPKVKPKLEPVLRTR